MMGWVREEIHPPPPAPKVQICYFSGTTPAGWLFPGRRRQTLLDLNRELATNQSKASPKPSLNQRICWVLYLTLGEGLLDRWITQHEGPTSQNSGSSCSACRKFNRQGREGLFQVAQLPWAPSGSIARLYFFRQLNFFHATLLVWESQKCVLFMWVWWGGKASCI